MTEARAAARALAAGRIVLGAALARALGVRDVLLGAMVLHTVDHPEVAPRWLAATAACDAVDFAAGAAVRSELPRVRGALGMAVAGGAAVAGAGLSRALAESTD